MIVKFDLTSCYALNHMICLYFISKYLIKQAPCLCTMEILKATGRLSRQRHLVPWNSTVKSGRLTLAHTQDLTTR